MKRKVTCPGCKRQMVQLTPKNRDSRGRSWHYSCLSDAVSTGLRKLSKEKAFAG